MQSTGDLFILKEEWRGIENVWDSDELLLQ
jgi:hypothetical protein